MKNDPTTFKDYQEAAEAIASAFIGENIAGPQEKPWKEKYTPLIKEALERDGHLPNWYEVEALNGGVPEDGRDIEDGEYYDADYGVPEEVSKKFPNTDKLIGSQF